MKTATMLVHLVLPEETGLLRGDGGHLVLL